MFYSCLIILYTILHTTPITCIESTTALASPTESSIVSTNIPPLPSSAAKLVRFRRQPPGVTILKHVGRSSKRSKPRRRVKRPKIKYGPPNYSYGEPITYYKPRGPSFDSPSFSLNDFGHVNVDAADFDLPSSSYEQQTMNFDLYSHGQDSYFESPKSSPIEFSLDTDPEVSSFTPFTPSKTKTYPPRTPHQKYGVPKEYEYPGSYDTHSSSIGDDSFRTSGGNSYGEEDSSYSTRNKFQPSYSDVEPPSTAYEQPSSPYGSPPPQQPDFYPSSPPSSIESQFDYSAYDKGIPNANYGASDSNQHGFGEPPVPATDVEITHSNSYEINLPSAHPGPTQFDNSYQAPDHSNSQPGNFAEPPAQPPSRAPEEPSIQTLHPSQQHPSPQEDYVPPSQELPLNPHHKQPAYDFPKSSYEVPIYDPIPFEASNNEEQEFYPPHPEPGSQHEETNFINQHGPPSHADASADASAEEASDDTHASHSVTSPATRQSPPHLRRTRKRKRIRGTTTAASAKHILDVPELELAYEAANHHKNRDADANESSHVENKQNFQPTPPPNTGSEPYVSQAWNPMRVRTSSRFSVQPTAAPIPFTTEQKHTAPPLTHSKPPRKPIRSRVRPAPTPLQSTTENTVLPSKLTTQPQRLKDPHKSATVIIEKSHSKSYYDGTIAPPTLNMSSLYKARLNKFRMPTRATLVALERELPKRTTKSVFDTTYFKSPQNDREVQRKLQTLTRNVPKNHKPY